MLRHGLTTAVFACIIAAALTIAGDDRWDHNLVYSLAIAMPSWLIIDAGRRALTKADDIQWPHGWRGLLLIAGGLLVGLGFGIAVGDLYAGRPVWQKLHAPQRLASTLVVSILAVVVITYYYYSLGKSRYLQDRIAVAQRDAAEARLRLLETQLEPHMLFNTLANLRVLITLDPPRAVAMLDRLNNYLRVTLAGSRALSHPLSAEFERLEDYLALMAVRMGDRLRYTLDLPPELRPIQVPPLLLQPLVENSLRHGLETKVEGGTIAVSASRRTGPGGAELVIRVADTGRGLEGPGSAPTAGGDEGPGADGSAVRRPATATARSGAAGPQTRPSGGFGLGQVRERLAESHGARAGFSLEPNPGGGAIATIVLPLAERA
ncbi:MAG: sensor histidine kinase [Comamonadaceae bacterium]|nr:MAG: sensor histidine kinase [Comamonadaceae bacterium]